MRRFGAVLAGAGLLAILVLTLTPNPRQAHASALTPLLCVVCGETGGADVVLNLLLFMPMAAGLALLRRPWLRIVGICLLLSLLVETVQYFPFTGRDASLSDVLTNTVGGALGAAITARAGTLLRPGPILARRLALAAGVGWLGILTFAAVAMRPWAPPGRLRNYCTAAYPMPDEFAGTARTMTLNGVELRCDHRVPGGTIRRELRRGEVALETVAEAGDPAAGRRVIQQIRTRRTPLVVLAQHGRDAVFQTPTASRALKLFAPIVRLPGAFPAGPGDPVELTGEAVDRRLRLSAVHDGSRREVDLPLSPAYGWTLLLPVPLEPGVLLRLVAALWLGGLILPAAYWAGLADRPRAATGALAGVVVAGLGLVPAIGGFDPVHWSEWLGAGAGIALGWALSRIATYLQSRCGSPSTSAYSSS
ncbi:MAG TPA: VanZ family protein [Gemmatimonadales bacterium]